MQNKKWLWAIPVVLIVIVAVVLGSTKTQKGAMMSLRRAPAKVQRPAVMQPGLTVVPSLPRLQPQQQPQPKPEPKPAPLPDFALYNLFLSDTNPPQVNFDIANFAAGMPLVSSKVKVETYTFANGNTPKSTDYVSIASQFVGSSSVFIVPSGVSSMNEISQVVATADYQNAVPETNENNNVLFRGFIQQPQQFPQPQPAPQPQQQPQQPQPPPYSQFSGVLNIMENGSPAESIVVAGSTGVVFSRYKFSAISESFLVKKLDIVGTTSQWGSFNQDPPIFAAGNNITRVLISYPTKNGTTEVVASNFSNGKASFINLNFYVPKDGSATITVLADLNTIGAGATSGAYFRLGLNEIIAPNSFEAIGESSATKKLAGDVTIAGSINIDGMVIRKTVPTVAKVIGLSAKLSNGLNTIAGVTVVADPKEDVSLKRMKFEFSSSDMDVSALDLIRRVDDGIEKTITNEVSIRNRAGKDLKNGGFNLATAGVTTTDTIYVTWDNLPTDHEDILKGTTNTYFIRATVANASANESLSTYIADDTDLINWLNSESANQILLTNANFIWSDNSSPQHSVFTKDWTNGLNVSNLPTQTLSLSF